LIRELQKVKRLLVPSSVLLWGFQFAFLTPTMALILVTLFEATPAEVGWVLAVYNASGFVAALVLPTYADRKRRLPAADVGVRAADVGAVAWLLLSTSLPVAVIGLVVLGGPAGVGSSLLYAHLRHSGASVSDVVNTRAIVSVAWVAGPPLATLIIGWFGNQAILVGLATGLYMNTRRVGAIVSGPIIAIGSMSALGYRGIFAVCAALTVVALVVIWAASRTTRRRQSKTDSASMAEEQIPDPGG
jgi:SET family sugar efflux transporter-like MFS transporter